MDLSVVVGPAVEVAKAIFGALSRVIDNLKNLKRNFEELNRKVQDLNSRVEDVQTKIGKKRASRECGDWLERAHDIQNKRRKIDEEYKNNKTCLGGWCPNIFSRLDLAERTTVLITEVNNWEDRYSKIKEDMVINEPAQFMGMPTPGVEVKNSTDHTVQELLEMIKNGNITKIGLWGMGGIGKTTIMKVLHDRQEVRQIFDLIIWVTVTKEGTITSVRQQLAQRLNVNVEGTNADILKSNVCKALKDKKFLLFLDDVWSLIDLEEVGVPGPLEGKGCNVVLSSRTRRVCQQMSTDEEINVPALSEEAAWSLFCGKVGEVARHPNMEAIAREVVRECDGLPLAILVVAGTLRKEKDSHVWRNVLKELRSSAGEIEEMEDRVFGCLKYSYDRLKDERSKQCFLYCALFPEDYEIPKVELVQYWINEGLIDGWNNLKEAEDKGFSKVKELIDASLVEEARVDFFYQQDCVKMHDLMRDLALRISSTNTCCRSFVRAGVKLSEMPKAEDWETAKRISLMKSRLWTLPQVALNCGMLTTLLLQGNSDLRDIPSDFFEPMPALQVLDLSGTGIRSLPPSIGNLANLRGLYLNDCLFLKVIPRQIGALTKLEIFQTKGRTTICYLPPEIERLASLKHLEVRCGPSHEWSFRFLEVEEDEEEELPDMQMFPRLSKLSVLERLIIFVGPDAGDWWGDYLSQDASMEISKLNKLTHLLFTFSKIDYFEDFVQRSSSWKHRYLTTFRIVIGFQQDHPTNVSDFADWDETHVNSLTVVGEDVALRRLSDLGLAKIHELEHFLAIGCSHMEILVLAESDGKQTTDLLPCLRLLDLHDLPNMKSIWEGPLPPPPPQGRSCLPSLTNLNISRCHRLKRIFSRALIAHLSNLQILRVEDCWEVEEIIGMDDQDEEVEVPIQEALLPQLKSLSLGGLSKLACICSSKELSSAGWPSLEQIRIISCVNLKSLPRGFAKAPNLQKIDCFLAWWEALEWEDDAFKQRLCSKAGFDRIFTIENPY